VKPPPGMFSAAEERVIATWEKYRAKIGELSHGTLTRYTTYGCRCNDCKAAGSTASKSTYARTKGTEPPEHGTTTGYKHYGCRCNDCKAAGSAASWEARSRLRGTEPPKHGTTTGYHLYGCRCNACKAAGSAARARHKARTS